MVETTLYVFASLGFCASKRTPIKLGLFQRMPVAFDQSVNRCFKGILPNFESDVQGNDT